MALKRVTQDAPFNLHQGDAQAVGYLQSITDAIAALQSGSGTTATFQGLPDGFKFPGQSLKSVRVNAGETALEAFTSVSSITSFTAADQSITVSSSTGVIAHGLGAIPTKVSGAFVCQVSERNWSIGDVLAYQPGVNVYFDGAANHIMGYTVRYDATNIEIYFGPGNTGLVYIPDKNVLTNYYQMTNADWKLRVTASL